MLILVQRQPRMAQLSRDKMLRLCRRANLAAAAWHSRARQCDSLARLD